MFVMLDDLIFSFGKHASNLMETLSGETAKL